MTQRTIAWRHDQLDPLPVLVLDDREVPRDERVDLPAGVVADLAAQAWSAGLLAGHDERDDTREVYP
jgi:hypothetical protein